MPHGRTRGKAAQRIHTNADNAETIHHAHKPEKPGGAGQPSKIDCQAFGFDHKPQLHDRTDLIAQARRLARIAPPNNLTAGPARAGVTMFALAEGTTDEATRARAIEALDQTLSQLASAPSLTTDDVAMKLAGLVLELMRRSDGGAQAENAPSLMLAASALADLTILRRGPIPQPPRGANGEGRA